MARIVEQKNWTLLGTHDIGGLLNDDIEWFDELRGDESEIALEIAGLIEEASFFYDREMERYSEE